MQLKDLTGDREAGNKAGYLLRRAGFILLLLTSTSSTLAADLTITQLANEGVMISDGQARILIDAMVVEPYSVYGGLPEDARALFDQRSGPFADIDLVLASHRHHDHNQPAFACEFMLGSADSLFVSSAQVIGLMREKCRDFMVNSPRVREIDPQYETPYAMEVKGAKINIFRLSHGTRKYAKIQNYGHLIEMSGFKIVHLGDAAMDATDFTRAGLDKVDLDVALIPFWYFQPGMGSEIVRNFLHARQQIAVHIPPGEMMEVEALLKEDWPHVVILKSPLNTLRVSEAAQPLQ